MTTTEAFAAIDRAALKLATPQFIDEALAEIYGRLYRAQDNTAMQAQHIINLRKAPLYNADRDVELLANAEAALAAYRQTENEIHAEVLPFIVEFRRRGGWTRAYLVQPGGHVHRSMQCATCFPTTRFGWLTQMSDHTEAEIVDLAGEGACSVCYPTAPRVGRNRLELPATIAGREERAAAKIARDVRKAAKAITNPDGSPLRGHWGRIETVAAAWSQVVDNIVGTRVYGYEARDDENTKIVAALAVKLCKTGDTSWVWSQVDTKVAAKIKREARG